MTPPEIAVVAVGSFRRLRELQRTLATGGVGAEIVEPPGTRANA